MSIESQIVDELREKFDRHPVWVWYDPRRKFGGVIDEVQASLEEDGVNVAIYDGSYIELKKRLWEEDPDIDENWLFYIDENREDAEWFKDIHRMGKQYRPGVDMTDNPGAKYLMERTEKIPEDFDEWSTDPEHLWKAFFSVLFGQSGYRPREFVVEFLSRPQHYADIIERYKQEDEWEDVLQEEFGIDSRFDPKEISKQILFGEVEATSPTNRFSELSANKPESARELCGFWQRHDTQEFLKRANEIAEEHDIEKVVVESDSLDWDSEAFREVDDGLLRLCLDRANETAVMELPELLPELTDLVERRMEGFWYNDGHTGYWEVLSHGFDTIERADTARSEISGQSPEELAERYTDEWWKVDREYRRYVRSQSETVETYEGLDEVGEKVTHHYTEFLEELNRCLADRLEDSSGLGTPQTRFWEDYVTDEEGTAIVICDALRYELARELSERLEDTESEVETDYMSASLPSVTEVGMSSHLPGPLSLGLNGDLQVSVDGQSTNKKSHRVDILEENGFVVEDLKEVANRPHSEMEGDLQPRVVYSGTIDKLGENVDDDEALVEAVDHVNKVEKAIRRLLSAGYTRFVVTSDHGFLYTERLPEKLKIDSPEEAEVTKRRFAVSETPISDDTVLSFDSDYFSDLGIDSGGLFFHFPRSVACFKTRGGNMRYFHGGVSMQELAVPCITVEAEAEEGEKIDVMVDFPTSVTNNIVTVDLSLSGQVSLEEREVILRAKVDGEDACEPQKVKVEHGENKESLRLKSGKLGGASSVSFEAVDADTREIIEEGRAKVDMVIQDEGFDI